MSFKLSAGETFPSISVTSLEGESCELGKPRDGYTWQAVFVYRGRHCPMCTRYLNALAKNRQAFADAGVDIIAVSADSKAQLTSHLEDIDINFPIAYGLTEKQMKTLGLYISIPRSEKETDHNFAEPGLFVVNDEGKLHVVDISNNPFVRPEINTLADGLAWIRDAENNYPIRGTLSE